MLNIKQLISELCPKGVECKPLGELCSIITKQTGFDYSNHIKNSLLSDKKEDTLPYIQTKFFTGKNFIYDTDYFIPLNVADRFPKILLDCKCLLFSIVGASIGNIGLFPGTVKAFCGGAICVAKPLQEYNIEYLYYYLSSSHGQKQIFNKVKGSGQATITIEDIRKFEIPVPPLPIQEEIVRILDELTKKTDMLISELNAELDERKKQFNYYLNACFPIESKDNRESKSLSEIGKFVRGKRFVKTDIIDTGTPCIHYGELYTYYGVWTEKAQSYLNPASSKSLRFASKNDIIIVGAGEDEWDIGIGVAWLNDEDVVIHDACYAFSHSMNPKYVSYFLRSDSYHLQIKPYVRTGKISAISSNDIGKARLLIPSLAEQELTAKLLDEFSLKYKTIIYELKTEIESRQKQYEYYRDKMLTFNRI